MGILDEIAKIANPFLSAPSNQANFLQRALEQQVANLKAGVTPQNSPGYVSGGTISNDPLQSLQDQLMAQISSVPSYVTPIEVLRKQAQSQMNAQYDPLINALMTQMGQTTQRAHKNEAQAKSMYNALGQSFAADLPGIVQQSKMAEQETQRRYANAQQSMQNDYAKQSADQQAILERLGIQAAAPAANSQQQADQAYFAGQNQLEKQSALDALKQQSAAAQTYQSNLADTSRMAGVNTAQDIASQLEQYLQQAQGQMGTLQAQKSSGLEALLAQMQNADIQSANKMHQQEIDNLMALANFKQKTLSNSSANGPFRGTSGSQGAANYLAQMLGPDRTGTASQIVKLITDTMQNKDVVLGKHKIGVDPYGKTLYAQNTDQFIQELLRRNLEKAGGFAPSDVNAAIDALMAYMGKLR